MMRAVPIALLLLLAGCLGATNAPTPDTNATGATSPELGALPAPIEDSQTATGSADPTNLALGMPVCSAPTAGCFRYPFTLNRTANITGDLAWTLPASDFDFYVHQGDTQVISGANDITAAQGAGATSEHLEGELEPGDYEIVVVPWAVTQDTFTLRATFG